MIRLLFVAVLVIGLFALVAYLVNLGIQAMLKRERQKYLARWAPEMLEHNDVPAPVANMLVEARQQNAEAAKIMQGVLYEEGYFGANDMENWLKKHDKKELTR